MSNEPRRFRWNRSGSKLFGPYAKAMRGTVAHIASSRSPSGMSYPASIGVDRAGTRGYAQVRKAVGILP